MEKDRRSFKRIAIGLEAYMYAGNKTFTGSIENVSEDGFEFLLNHSDALTDLKPGKIIELYFQVPSGEALNLLCEVQWSSLDEKTLTLGIKILKSSPKYNEFIKTLDIVTVN